MKEEKEQLLFQQCNGASTEDLNGRLFEAHQAHHPMPRDLRECRSLRPYLNPVRNPPRPGLPELK